MESRDLPGQRHVAGERIGQMSSAVEQTGDSVFITDREGRIEYVNNWVYSEPGHGTSFKVYLPRVPVGAEAAGADEPRPA